MDLLSTSGRHRCRFSSPPRRARDEQMERRRCGRGHSRRVRRVPRDCTPRLASLPYWIPHDAGYSHRWLPLLLATTGVVVAAVKAGGWEDAEAERRTGDIGGEFRAAVRRDALHRDARHCAPLAETRRRKGRT
jgi:hypothetical protein